MPCNLGHQQDEMHYACGGCSSCAMWCKVHTVVLHACMQDILTHCVRVFREQLSQLAQAQGGSGYTVTENDVQGIFASLKQR